MQMIRQALAPLAAGLLFLVAHGGGLAQSQKPQVENVWASATVPGQSVGAAYMRIASHEPVALIHIETAVAGRVQVHMMHTDKGVMKMREITELAIAAGQPVSLSPGNTHLMLLGLKKPLKAGESFSLTLTFRHADKQESQVTVNVPVRPMGG